MEINIRGILGRRQLMSFFFLLFTLSVFTRQPRLAILVPLSIRSTKILVRRILLSCAYTKAHNVAEKSHPGKED